MTQFKFLSNVTDNSASRPCRCRPHLNVCHHVVQQCPYYTPAREQKVGKDTREILYGGLPAFMCPSAGKYLFVKYYTTYHFSTVSYNGNCWYV